MFSYFTLYSIDAPVNYLDYNYDTADYGFSDEEDDYNGKIYSKFYNKITIHKYRRNN